MTEVQSPDLATPYPTWHMPGHRESLLEALHTTERWGWTPDELLRTDPAGIVASELVVARWKLAAAIRPDLNGHDTLDRLMYRWVDIPVRYSAGLVVHDVTPRMSEAGLVSSMLQDGTHRPALDLDYPAELWEDPTGARWLRIEPASPAIDRHGIGFVDEADRAMAALGLHRDGRPDGPVRSCRSEGRLIARLGEQWSGGWNDLVEVASSMTVTGDTQQAPYGGIWYRLEGAGRLVPSTSWSHLYLENRVDAGTYRNACQVAAGCGLLNPGYVNALESRGFTSLRRPGMWKKDAEPLPVEDIPF